MLIAAKYDGSPSRRSGHPRVMEAISQQTVRMAKENPCWGYTGIQGALRAVGHPLEEMTCSFKLTRSLEFRTRLRLAGFTPHTQTRVCNQCENMHTDRSTWCFAEASLKHEK